MDDVAPPFGSFMEAMPHWAFIIIHSILVLVGLWLARKTKLNGFLLFVLAELSYVTYHAGLTHFLFAHIIAEVCDALALVTIALGLTAPVAGGSVQSGGPSRHAGTDRRRTPAGSSRSAPKCRSRKVLQLAHSLGRRTS